MNERMSTDQRRTGRQGHQLRNLWLDITSCQTEIKGELLRKKINQRQICEKNKTKRGILVI